MVADLRPAEAQHAEVLRLAAAEIPFALDKAVTREVERVGAERAVEFPAPGEGEPYVRFFRAATISSAVS